MTSRLAHGALATLLGCAVLASTTPAAAAEGGEPLRSRFQARDTADLRPPGGWSVGIFEPLSYALTERVELRGHPVLFLVSPNLVVRIRHGEAAGFRFTGEYGASVPTPALKLSQGYLLPAWDRSDHEVGWIVVPRAGLVASRGAPDAQVLTLRADLAAGLPLTRNDARPLGGIAPLDVLMAPAFSGFRARAGAAYDFALARSWRAQLDGNLWFHGPQPSFWSASAGCRLELALGSRLRLAGGGVWWNADTGAIDLATHERQRSNDFLPTLDLVWVQ